MKIAIGHCPTQTVQTIENGIRSVSDNDEKSGKKDSTSKDNLESSIPFQRISQSGPFG